MVIALLFSFTLSFAQGKAKYVVLITIDGLRPEFYLDERWGMPNLRHMMEHGVAAKGVVPVYPSVTYVNHTSMITGVVPARHGIYYNGPFDVNGKSKWYWYYDAIKVKTVFNVMQEAKQKTASILWPVTVNAPIDYNIPPIVDPVTKDRTKAAKYVRPLYLWTEIQDGATGKLKPEDWDLSDHEIKWDQNISRAAAYMIEKYRPNFFAIHFVTADHSQHLHGLDDYLTKAAITGIDNGLRNIMEAVKRAGIADSTAIIITGDHGFENVYRRFNPNVLLKSNKLFNHEHDWKAAFYASGGSSFLYLKDKNDAQTLKQVKQLLADLPDSVKQYFRVIDKEMLKDVGSDPLAAIALSGMKGTTVGNSIKGQLLENFKSVKGQHGFFPDNANMFTGFVGYGAGFKKGVMVQQMKLLDIAPIIATLTNSNFPEGQLKIDQKLMTQLIIQ